MVLIKVSRVFYLVFSAIRKGQLTFLRLHRRHFEYGLVQRNFHHNNLYIRTESFIVIVTAVTTNIGWSQSLPSWSRTKVICKFHVRIRNIWKTAESEIVFVIVMEFKMIEISGIISGRSESADVLKSGPPHCAVQLSQVGFTSIMTLTTIQQTDAIFLDRVMLSLAVWTFGEWTLKALKTPAL
jgi:hypothetical protein